MKSLAILIPVYNGVNYTKKCLKDLEKSFLDKPLKHCKTEIVVVDDGSKDETSDWIRENMPSVHLLQGDGNLWWSGAINKGAEYALNQLKCDFLLLWNNDIVPADDYFIQIEKIIAASNINQLIGSKIYKLSPSNVIWSFGGYFNPKSGRKFMIGSQTEDNDEFQYVKHVDWLTGMGTLIPKAVIDTIGYWDNTNFPQYHGDSDFTYRAKRNGFDVLVHPELKIWNDTENTGIQHQGKFNDLIGMLTDIKSQHNIRKNFLFYSKYTKSMRAYLPLLRGYYRLIGGFFKWKFLEFFNIQKTKS